MRNILLPVLFFFLWLSEVSSQEIVGYWKTIDEVTEQPKSILEIYKEDEGLSARVVEILVEGREDALCIKCDGPQKNRPIKGMRIFSGLKKVDEDTYGDGEILDPETGKKYRVRIWLDSERPERLKVRGYIAFFFRTQTWKRVSP